jgi:microsomal epoxide hydrolase
LVCRAAQEVYDTSYSDAARRIGEKFIVWSDKTPPIPTILSNVSLYYLTNTFPTSLYHYRASYGKQVKKGSEVPEVKNKPVGYSQFAKEILPTPKDWLEGTNVVWHRRHEEVSEIWRTGGKELIKLQGGHFAALEQPEVLWQDVLDFIACP